MFLLLGVAVVGLLATTKSSEAELRQAIRAKAIELHAKGLAGTALLIDEPQYVERFTYHDRYIASEIRFTTDDGKIITVARGQLGNITVWEK